MTDTVRHAPATFGNADSIIHLLTLHLPVKVLLLERDSQLLDDLGSDAAARAQDPQQQSLAEAAQEVSSRRRGVPQWTQPHVSTWVIMRCTARSASVEAIQLRL